MQATAKKTTILEWRHEPANRFDGANSEATNFALVLTPPDPKIPDCCYFNVQVIQTCTNYQNGPVFLGKTLTTFRIHNKGERPTVAFLFYLLVESGGDFARTHHERVTGTNLSHHQIAVPQIEQWRADIEICIQIWDNTLRNVSLN
jgi:hypothetical protein